MPTLAFSQYQVQFQEISFVQALQKSSVTHKPVFFMGYASWCEHCKYMKEQVFTDSAVAGFLNQHFVSFKIDMEKGEGIALAKKLAVKSLPTLIFLDSSGNTLYRIVGEWKKDDFLIQAKNALTPELQLPYLRKQYESDKSNPEKCYPYIRALRRGNMDVQQVADEYFLTQSDSQLLSEINWKILANGEFDITSHPFKFLIAHQKEFAAITSPERVERKLLGTVAEVLSPLITNKDSLKYFELKSAAVAIRDYKIDSLLFTMDITLMESTGNWSGYQKVTSESVTKYLWQDYVQLKNICDQYLKHITDLKALIAATEWASRTVQLHEDYGTWLLCSRLYLKAGKKPEAFQMAQKAKNTAVKNGWSTDEADVLLKQTQ